MVGYLKVHLRLNDETLILILCSSHTLISYMDNCLHIFVLSSPLQSSSPSSFYNSPHPFQCPLLTPPHTLPVCRTNSSLSLSISGPRFDSVESSFFFFFFSLLFFFSLSLSARWFNTYQIPILFLSSFSFFPSLALFFPFWSSSNFPLAFLLFFFLLFFSHSIPSSCFLFSSPFCCFSFSLSSLSSFLPPPCPNACPTPPHYSFKKSWGEHWQPLNVLRKLPMTSAGKNRIKGVHEPKSNRLPS